jgi:hypothetical protein
MVAFELEFHRSPRLRDDTAVASHRRKPAMTMSRERSAQHMPLNAYGRSRDLTLAGIVRPTPLVLQHIARSC